MARNLGLELNYIWRKYDQFAWRDTDNWDSNNFQAFTLSPACTGAAAPLCGPVTYYRATSPLPSPFVYTNQPDRYRRYNGVEVALQKRYSDRWMANASFAYNAAKDYWDSPRAYEDPTNIVNLNGAEFAPESGGSGIDNIFTNANWLFKLNGMYTVPRVDVNVSGNMQYRQGYPYPNAITVTSRGNGLNNINVLINPLGETRRPNVVYGDLSVSRAFTFRHVRLVPEMAVFNVGNVNTVLARRRIVYSHNAASGAGSSPANADLISGVIAPRVIRFGVRVSW